MATHQDYILAPPTVGAEFAVAPATNFVSSLYTLQLAKKYSGLAEWVTRTASALKPRQREDNFLFVEFCFEAVRPKKNWDDVEAYLNHVAQLDAETLGQQVRAQLYEGHKAHRPADVAPPPEELLGDFGAFEALFKSAYAHSKLPQKTLKRIHQILNRPEALLETILSHLNWMWTHAYREEWQTREPLLAKCVAAFRQVPLAGLSTHEMVTKVIGREPNSHKHSDQFNSIEKIVFTPSPHIGPYALIFRQNELLQVLFGARLPEGMRGDGDLDRSDLLTKLSALVDDTRLKIVELLTLHEELSAQDVMEMLNQSQSSISRHLIQLQSTGLLEVRREARGKKVYRLNPARVQSTLQSLGDFLRPKHD